MIAPCMTLTGDGPRNWAGAGTRNQTGDLPAHRPLTRLSHAGQGPASSSGRKGRHRWKALCCESFQPVTRSRREGGGRGELGGVLGALRGR